MFVNIGMGDVGFGMFGMIFGSDKPPQPIIHRNTYNIWAQHFSQNDCKLKRTCTFFPGQGVDPATVLIHVCLDLSCS